MVTHMNNLAKRIILVLLTSVMLAACSSAPEAKRDPYNDADSQRSRAKQAQDELSSDTMKSE